MDRERNGLIRIRGFGRIGLLTSNDITVDHVTLDRNLAMTSTLKVSEVLEIALYVTDLTAAEYFYTKILGLSLYSKVVGRHVFLRCGARMVLLFNAKTTIDSESGPLGVPKHGMRGEGHIAFAVRDHEIDQWKEHLTAHGINIEKEICWENGRSIYFRDPSGNSIEITSPAIWGIEEDMFF